MDEGVVVEEGLGDVKGEATIVLFELRELTDLLGEVDVVVAEAVGGHPGQSGR